MKILIVLALVSINLSCFGREITNFNQFCSILGELESSNNSRAVGDNNKAIGIFQIHEACWRDAVEHDKSIGGKYVDCFFPEYSKKIVKAYLSRYCKSDNFEDMARCWNGGWNWKEKTGQAKINLDRYWAKFSVILLNERNNFNK